MGYRPIAHQEKTTAKNENLPLPIVYYPGFYGTFFAFSKDKQSDLQFCSCSKKAIKNYIEFKIRNTHYPTGSEPDHFILSSDRHFPKKIVKKLIENGVNQNRSILEHLKFGDNLCHQCNRVLPKYRYCNSMYGTEFKQNYGWYINQKSLELGVDKNVSDSRLTHTAPIPAILFDKASESILSELDDDIREKIDLCHKYRERSRRDNIDLTQPEEAKLDKLMEEIKEQSTKIKKIIENEVRKNFGHYGVGNRWTSETILYQLLRENYPNYTLKRHYRPDFLNGLELDIYIKEERIGIEYQGIQHYEPVEHWGGEQGLEERKKRDELKKELCKENEVKLIYFRYDEELSEDLVKDKLNELL